MGRRRCDGAPSAVPDMPHVSRSSYVALSRAPAHERGEEGGLGCKEVREGEREGNGGGGSSG